MKDLVDSTPLLDDPAALRARLDSDSYLYFPGLLPRERVLQTRAEFLDVLASVGWLAPGSPPDDAVASSIAEPERTPPSEHYLSVYALVQRLQSFHELAIEPALVDALAAVFGEAVVAHPMKIARLGVPTPERWTTPPHQDFPILRSTVDFVTTWIPLGDCPVDLGGLKVLRGSHRGGARPPQGAMGVGGTGVEHDPDSDEWSTVDYRAGDVLVFHSLTIHGAIPNTTDRIRLSADFRFQAVRSPMRRVLLRPHYCPWIPDYDVLTEGWTSRRSIEVPAEVPIVPDEDLGPTEPELVTLDS